MVEHSPKILASEEKVPTTIRNDGWLTTERPPQARNIDCHLPQLTFPVIVTEDI